MVKGDGNLHHRHPPPPQAAIKEELTSSLGNNLLLSTVFDSDLAKPQLKSSSYGLSSMPTCRNPLPTSRLLSIHNHTLLMEQGSGIPGDGRCLFRSITHGACLRAGNSSPSEYLQKQLADELRAKVVDEFIRRRVDTEWFLEGDFNTYVRQMRAPHTWGGEPELLMSSHVLQMPITVLMKDKNTGNLKIIAEYGQEYGKENPIRVLYHGHGHYDALESLPGG